MNVMVHKLKNFFFVYKINVKEKYLENTLERGKDACLFHLSTLRNVEWERVSYLCLRVLQGE